MQKYLFIETCNQWSKEGIPFLFVIDYELQNFHIYKIRELAEEKIFYSIQGNGNTEKLRHSLSRKFLFEATPVSYPIYEQACTTVKKNILYGNSFLLNLTFPSKLKTDLSMQEIFKYSKAPYKLNFKDQFVVFSPERFVRIAENFIYSNPMKGTIDASVKGAKKSILTNEKEMWEHNTIVDLIRNDLSMVSKEVCVTRNRYIEKVRTHKNELFQVSSEIRGSLERNWRKNLGDILIKLLPAGSICGAPKKKTLEIISKVEGIKRGYFTGIFGIFNGNELDSAVMIRYIEKTPSGLQFRSGGGITGHSNPENEYQELKDKVYVPII